MTFPREQIIAWAKEADVWVVEQEPYQTQLERFAAIIEQATIERCAEVCEQLKAPDERHSMWAIGTHDCAAAIRALKEQA